MEAVVKVLLRARSGEVRAYALVDADRAAEVLADRWHLDSDGYVKRWTPRFAGKQWAIYLHRQLLGVLGDGAVEGDHINGDRLDNRLRNLRLVSHAANGQNRNFCNTGSSRFRGVTWDRSRGVWIAQARLAGKLHHLGRFQSEVAAAQVVDAWRLEHMPFAQPDPELPKHYEEAA
jgi:hypothetical protein